MATQNSKKSKKAAPKKAAPVKAAAPKKAAKKAPVKTKTAAKVTKPVAKAKKSSPVKAKVAPVKGKAKPAPAKKASAPARKVTVPAKSKPAPAKAIKSPAAKSAKPTVKVAASKSNAGVKGKAAPNKPQPITGSSKSKVTTKPVTKPMPQAKPVTASKPVTTTKSVPVTKTAPVNKSVPATKTEATKTAPVTKAVPATKTAPVTKTVTANKPVPAAKPVPAVKPVPVATKTTAPAKTTTPQSKPIQVVGSKSTDVAKKPTISTLESGKEKSLPKTTVSGTPFRPTTESKLKPFEKMTDKKEHKPATTIAAEEPQKSRYSDKELEEFNQLIDQKLIIAREQLEFYLKQLEDMAENPDNKIKGLDDGLSTLESERVSSLASRQQKLIQHLENAKIRIKNKVYGICRETGRLISKERLRAVPHATLSIEAKQAQN